MQEKFYRRPDGKIVLKAFESIGIHHAFAQDEPAVVEQPLLIAAASETITRLAARIAELEAKLDAPPAMSIQGDDVLFQLYEGSHPITAYKYGYRDGTLAAPAPGADQWKQRALDAEAKLRKVGAVLVEGINVREALQEMADNPEVREKVAAEMMLPGTQL